MMHRETILSWGSDRQVIRTEIGGRIKTEPQLEAAHTKAVKNALIARRVESVECRYWEGVKANETADYTAPFPIGGASPEEIGEQTRARLRSQIEEAREKGLKAAKVFPNHVKGMSTYEDCRKGFPAIRYNREGPATLAASWAGVTYEDI
jgi:hypothetical protein